MSRDYREMDSKIDELMQKSFQSILNDTKMLNDLVSKMDKDNKTDDISILARFVFHFLENIFIRIFTLNYLQKESLHNFVWTQEQIELINERFEKINPEDTKEIKSKVDEMHNKFESTLGTLSARLEKMNQQEEEIKKKMKDNMFYG